MPEIRHDFLGIVIVASNSSRCARIDEPHPGGLYVEP